ARGRRAPHVYALTLPCVPHRAAEPGAGVVDVSPLERAAERERELGDGAPADLHDPSARHLALAARGVAEELRLARRRAGGLIRDLAPKHDGEFLEGVELELDDAAQADAAEELAAEEEVRLLVVADAREDLAAAADAVVEQADREAADERE